MCVAGSDAKGGGVEECLGESKEKGLGEGDAPFTSTVDFYSTMPYSQEERTEIRVLST